ncbi:LGFP repeat-containing protein [Mycolicibacterium mucogenicum 261Sha1.1M5]|nr:LGFP repeat-containing protein [Mycolicibacterium mucogenicum 261Sha1.1M5]
MRPTTSPQADPSSALRLPALRKPVRAFATIVATLAVAVGFLTAPQAAMAAGPSDGFQAGNIVSDANFYDGNAMSAAQVQTFLNQQVPECWLGRKGYEVGKRVTWGGVSTTLASKCTRDYVAKTQSRASNAYCSAYVGGGNETAAQIVAKVGKACGISQRVLLITLQKEQSLITDPWPNNEQYFKAMGYACPDSGPGGTANCDPTQGGFFQQVYRAAWQLKVYRAFPNSYNYKPFQNNTIQWHPNTSCGTSSVRIENWATAALYIYTPYRPNQAALNAGWGTGDNCSSYGNRNFYNFYKAWFGSPAGPEVHSRVQAAYGAVGGSAGRLGQPTAKASIYANGAVGQGFTGGSIYWSSKTGAQVVYTTPIRDFYWANGSWTGPLGFPSGKENAYRDGGVGQGFEGGSVYVGPRTGGAIVSPPIRDEYWRLGSVAGTLGYPTGGASHYKDGGKGQGFEAGSIYWSEATGARKVSGAVRDAFWKNGSISGLLGYPTGNQNEYLSGGIGQAFSGGSIYGRNGQEAFAISGSMLSRYWAQKSTTGVLRYPTGPMLYYKNGGFGQPFEGGSLYQSSTGAAWEVTGPILRRYWAIKSGAGVVGYPIGSPVTLGGDQAVQRFERGVIYQEDAESAWEVFGLMLEAYEARGAQGGPLGFPVGALVKDDAGVSQQFRNGSLRVDDSGKVSVQLAPSQRLQRAEQSPPAEASTPGANADGSGAGAAGETSESSSETETEGSSNGMAEPLGG